MLRQAQHERRFWPVTLFVVAVGFVLVPHTVPALTVEEVALLKTPDRQKVLEEGAKKEGKLLLVFYADCQSGIAAD
jgi:hypothetical protein